MSFPRQFLLLAAVLLVLGLAACSGGDDPAPAEDPAAVTTEVATEPPSQPSSPTVDPSQPAVVPSSEATDSGGSANASATVDLQPVAGSSSDESLPSLPDVELPEPEPRPEMNWQDFPNVSLLVQPFDIIYWVGGPIYTMPRPQLLERITYDTGAWHNMRREPLVSLEYFTTKFSDLFVGSRYRGSASGGGNPMLYTIRFYASPDATTVFAAICEDCDMYSGPEVGRWEFFQSNDGGLSWHHILTVPRDTGYSRASGVVWGGEGEGYQLLLNFYDGLRTHRLYPGGRDLAGPEPPEGYKPAQPLVADGQLNWVAYRMSEPGKAHLLAGEEEWRELPEETREEISPVWPWPHGSPTYVDPETGETVSLLVPPDTLPPDSPWRPPQDDYPGATFSGERWRFIGLRHGPFLTVSWPKPPRYCESIRAAPDTEAKELSCVVEGVLLSDLQEELEVNGQKWHQVQTPDGTVGWVLRGRINLR